MTEGKGEKKEGMIVNSDNSGLIWKALYYVVMIGVGKLLRMMQDKIEGKG